MTNRRTIGWLALALLASCTDRSESLSAAASPLGGDLHTITVGTDVVITGMNHHVFAIEDDPENPSSPRPPDSRLSAGSEGRIAYASVIASDRQAAVARGEVGIVYDLLPGTEDWNAVKDKPVWVVLDLSYHLDASYEDGTGSANAAIAIRPLAAAPGWYTRIGRATGAPGSADRAHVAAGFLSTPDQLGDRIVVEAYAQAHAVAGADVNAASVDVEVHSIAFDFTPPVPTRTFTFQLESKLWIDSIGWFDCGNPSFLADLVLPYPVRLSRRAAYQAFCQASAFDDDPPTGPPTGAAFDPLDARIRGGAEVQFTCEAGKTVPIGPAGVTPLATESGWEGPFFKGVVNPIAIRDDLLVDGTFRIVTSGHPNPLVEPSFQAFWPRSKPDIWNAIDGRITCGVDAAGLPTATVTHDLVHTAFPSHRVFVTSGRGSRVLFDEPQGLFSRLWTLPAIPTP